MLFQRVFHIKIFLYAKWEKNSAEPIKPNDEIMSKDICYLTDKEIKIRNEIILQKNKTYIESFGYNHCRGNGETPF